MGLFGNKKKLPTLNESGWTVIQEADAEKHILGIRCRVENEKVVEVIIRHNDGEEVGGKVLLNGENALPIEVGEFKKLYEKDKLEIK